MRAASLFAVTLAVCLLGCMPTLPGATLPDWDAVFERSDGWTGADGAYSVELSPGRTLWLFGDSWIGPVRDGRHVDATMVNNTIAVMHHEADTAPRPDETAFVWGPDVDGRATAWLVPDSQVWPAAERHWFWPQAAVMSPRAEGEALVIFVQRLIHTGGDSVFAFQHAGSGMAIVDDPAADPSTWSPRQLRFEFGTNGDIRRPNWGAAATVHDGMAYIWGVDDIDAHEKTLYVARVDAARVAEATAWQFYSAEGTWSGDPNAAAPVLRGVSSEMSIHWHGDRWLMTYSQDGFSDLIRVRSAPTPTGPWSAPVSVYRVDEIERRSGYMTYAGKSHPQLTDDGIILTYVVNSVNFFDMASDASIYRPRFVRIPEDALP